MTAQAARWRGVRSATWTIPIGAVVAAAAVGATVGSSQAGLILALGVMIIGAIAVLTWVRPGVVAAVVLAGVLDLYPGISLQYARVGGGLVGQDLLVALLVMLLAFAPARSRQLTPPGRAGRAMFWLAAGLAFWWAITILRTLGTTSSTITVALNFGKDFLFLAMLLPLAYRALRDDRFRRDVLIVTFCLVAYAAVTQSIVAIGLNDLPQLVHPLRALETMHGRRLYTISIDLIAIVTVASAAAVIATRPRPTLLRWTLGAVAVAGALATVLALTRALYLGLALGVLAALAASTASSRALRARALMVGISVVLVIVPVGAAATLVIPGASSTANQAIARASSLASEFTGASDPSANTVTYRARLSADMLDALGSYFPVGLGFVDPRVKYFSQFPNGSIRNSDVGGLNALMTMGVVGMALVYAPLLYLLWTAARRLPSVTDPNSAGLLAGSIAAITLVVATSVSLVILFRPSGVCIVAMVAGLCAAELDRLPSIANGRNLRQAD
jgi:hypothetical protein